MSNVVKLGSVATALAADDLLTVEQLAARLQVSTSWIFEQTRSRARVRHQNKTPFPVIYLSQKKLRFSWTAVSAWILENQA